MGGYVGGRIDIVTFCETLSNSVTQYESHLFIWGKEMIRPKEEKESFPLATKLPEEDCNP